MGSHFIHYHGYYQNKRSRKSRILCSAVPKVVKYQDVVNSCQTSGKMKPRLWDKFFTGNCQILGTITKDSTQPQPCTEHYFWRTSAYPQLRWSWADTTIATDLRSQGQLLWNNLPRPPYFTFKPRSSKPGSSSAPLGMSTFTTLCVAMPHSAQWKDSPSI